MESSQFNHQRIYTNERFKNGQTTDDSEMALAKAFAIMDMKDINNLDQNLIFYYYGIWIMSMPLDQGFTTSSALHNFRIQTMPINGTNLFSDEIRKKIATQNCNSKANGGLMRISTLIVWYYYKNKNEIKNILKTDNKTKFLELYNNIYLEVKKDFEITHPNKENIVYTFCPQTNNVIRNIFKEKRSKSSTKIIRHENTRDNSKSKINYDYLNELYLDYKKRNLRIKKLREENDKEDGLSFTPYINKNSRLNTSEKKTIYV